MTLAERIVDGIISDLSDRRGLGQEWDQIDDDIKDDIRNKWINDVEMEVRVEENLKRVEEINRSIYPGK